MPPPTLNYEEPVNSVDTVDTVDTAGAAETSPNFARNSPTCFLDHALKTAEYQRSDFKV